MCALWHPQFPTALSDSTIAWLWACLVPALCEIMKKHSEFFEVATRGKGTYEITDRIADAVANSAVATGTATVFIQHTSASLIVFEKADRSERVDLNAFFERLVLKTVNTSAILRK